MQTDPKESTQQQTQQSDQQQSIQTVEIIEEGDIFFIDTSEYEKKSQDSDKSEKR